MCGTLLWTVHLRHLLVWQQAETQPWLDASRRLSENTPVPRWELRSSRHCCRWSVLDRFPHHHHHHHPDAMRIFYLQAPLCCSAPHLPLIHALLRQFVTCYKLFPLSLQLLCFQDKSMWLYRQFVLLQLLSPGWKVPQFILSFKLLKFLESNLVTGIKNSKNKI